MNYSFENTSDIDNNDIVLPGSPFLIGNFRYNFQLKPHCRYWRFGIRMSKTQDVEFWHPNHRYKHPDHKDNYIDLHIGVGKLEHDSWSEENVLHLAQYNVPDMPHILTRQDFTPLSEVGWSLNFDVHSNQVISIIGHATNQELPSTVLIRLPPEFKYFKVFAWADRLPFKIDCSLEVTSFDISNNSTLDFKVGNIFFRKGDMFDFAIGQKANVFLLTVSATGVAAPHILDRAVELGIPLPTPKKPGTVELYEVKSNQFMLAGYGYLTHNTETSTEIIAELATNIKENIERNKQALENCIGISLPLMGAGTEKISPLIIASIFDEIFNIGHPLSYIVSITNQNAFLDIKKFFWGRFEESNNELEEKHAPKEIIEFANKNGLDLSNIVYGFNQRQEIVRLTIENSYLDHISPYSLEAIKQLSLSNCTIGDFSFLAAFESLKTLTISSCSYKDWKGIDAVNLSELNLNNLAIRTFEFIESLKNLRSLRIRNTLIASLEQISNLKKLKALDLQSTELEKLNGIEKLVNLTNLILHNNKISTLEPLKGLKKLDFLDVSNNLIKNLDPIMFIKNLKYLLINKNPVIDKENVILDDSRNHLFSIRNILLKKIEDDLEDFRIPCKILLLGNHGTGKSSLLNILQGRSDSLNNSTHIIKIEKYPFNEKGIPKAIFFDFGGQDYYHGIYRAFLSGGSAYLILFNVDSNHNKRRRDKNDVLTQDFHLEYWLSQKRHFEQRMSLIENDPVLLIQTYADKHDRLLTINSQIKIDDTFYVCLTNEEPSHSYSRQLRYNNGRKYLTSSITDYIESTSQIVKRPKWFVSFVEKILELSETASHEAMHVDDLANFYKRPVLDEDVQTYMRDDLDQLHKQGIILYYKDYLPETIWLNPVAVVTYIHENILNREKIKNNHGISEDEIDNYDSNIVRLLTLQKVLFFHAYGKKQKYIIPNFLPLFEEEEFASELLVFGMNKPCLILKFNNFLPFGLINQLICFYGLLPEHKAFWRDRLLFKLGNTKVLIDMDMQQLEIKINIVSNPSISSKDTGVIEKYLFLSIMGQYWDMGILTFNDFIDYEGKQLIKESLAPNSQLYRQIAYIETLTENKQYRPDDLFLSRDNKNFVSYTQLCESENLSSINAFEKDSSTGLLSNKINIIESYQFQVFTNTKLKKSFKAVISYSKQDLKYVDKFRQYLEPLREQGLLDHHWYCTLLLAGEEWNDKIQREFDQADIIFFMVSENLMSTQYVKENEIKNAIDKFDEGEDILIIPILLVPYNFKGSGKYDLTRFSALPYSLKPITEFDNEHIGWHIVSEIIRITLERKLNPTKIDDPFYPQLERYLQKVIKGEHISYRDRL